MLINSLVPGADIGVSLIIFTLLIRFLMYPMLKSQLHQTRLIRKLQPKIVKIKKECKGNRQLEAMRMMELYKNEGVSPFRSIGMLLVQLPILFGLFFAVRILAFERERIAEFTYDFAEKLDPIRAIIENTDNFNNHMFGIIHVSNTVPTSENAITAISLILIAFIGAYAQRIMSKQTMPHQKDAKRLRDIFAEAANKGKEPDQAEVNAAMMNNMMKFMPYFMFFIMITLPAALAWYYAVSNIVAVIQQKYILGKDVEEMEELAEEVIEKQETKKAKKTSSKKREKAAKEANVTRIVAKDKGVKKKKG